MLTNLSSTFEPRYPEHLNTVIDWTAKCSSDSFCLPSQAIVDMIDELFSFLSHKEFSSAGRLLEEFIRTSGSTELPEKYLSTLHSAILTGDWNKISDSFREEKFIGPNGLFLIVSPFSIRRNGQVFCELTGIFGSILQHPFKALKSLQDILSRLQKQAHQPGKILPVISHATMGFTGSDTGEAFLVPNGWRIRGSSLGPGLNDLLQQRSRFMKYGKTAIQNIFDAKSAEILLAWTETTQSHYKYQNFEFQYHELGHSTGFGLPSKIKDRIFLTPWYAAVEEWRSDGVGLSLARQTLSNIDFCNVIAANICLRFGTDSQRAGGMELDSDVNAGLILFDRLLHGGHLAITGDYKLALAVSSLEELSDLADSMMADARHLTKEENSLQNIRGIWNLYGSIKVDGISRTLFDLMVRKPNSTLNCKLR